LNAEASPGADPRAPRRSRRTRFARWWRNRLTELTLSALLVLFVFAYFADTMLVTIRAGELGVKYKRFAGGTITDFVYPEGFHFVLPWDHLYVYDVRLQQVRRKLELLTLDGLPIMVEGIVRYRPSRSLLGMLHKHVGPDYVERIVMPEVDAALRTHVGRHTAEELYKATGNLLNDV
jgi:regulator of protease activity HflC (stomatin/prohibitin superfamily)